MTLSLSKSSLKTEHGSRPKGQDILLAVILAVAAGLISYYGAQLINPALTWDKQTGDTWFNNDTTRSFDDIAVYAVDHYRTNLHPLFVILTMPFVYALRGLFSVDAVTAVRIVLAANTSIWFGVLFITLRLIGCRRLDATLFSILAAVSAASVFWFTIPETYPFGSTTMLLGLTLVALAEYQKLSPLWYVFVGVLTLGITITNKDGGNIRCICQVPLEASSADYNCIICDCVPPGTGAKSDISSFQRWVFAFVGKCYQ